MIKVWILIAFMNSTTGKAGGPIVIDNLASKEECVRVQTAVNKLAFTVRSQCIETWKIK